MDNALTLCKHCETCKDYEYNRKGKNGKMHSFLYCNGGKEEVMISNWYITRDGYAYTTSKIDGKKRLYHTLFKKEEGMVIDHINGDRGDNRLRNLREITPLMNVQNYHNKRTSKFPGVYWNRKYGYWQVSVRRFSENNPDFERVCLGCFNDELEAYDAYVKELEKQGRGYLTDTPAHLEYLKWKESSKQTTLI